MRSWSPKSDMHDDRAGQRPFVRQQAADGSLLYVYHIPGPAHRLRQEMLIVRLNVDGEVFLSIDRK